MSKLISPPKDPYPDLDIQVIRQTNPTYVADAFLFYMTTDEYKERKDSDECGTQLVQLYEVLKAIH